MDLAWLHDLPSPLPERELSRNGRRGLAIARILERHYPDHHGDGINNEAREYDVTASTLRRWIHTAHHELHRPPRTCELCDQTLPLGARRSRRYCNQHNTTLARVHRHRAANPRHAPTKTDPNELPPPPSRTRAP